MPKIENKPKTKRAIDALGALGIHNKRLLAAGALAETPDYKKAALIADVTPETVRAWTNDPNFVAAIGWFAVAVADNRR